MRTEPNTGVQKRARTTFSCTFCRNRKLKCDRCQPCANCTKRQIGISCTYASSSPYAFGGSAPQDHDDRFEQREVMQYRIDKLERIVLSLVDKSPGNAGDSGIGQISPQASESNSPRQQSLGPINDHSAANESDFVTKSFGHLQVHDDQPSYIGDSHWATILQELSEVKAYLSERQHEDVSKNIKAGNERSTPAFFLGGDSVKDYDEIFTRLPGKNEVDKLVNRYFDDYDPGLYILHMPAWRRRYADFWTDPGKRAKEPAFLAQVCAICGLAMQSYAKDPEEPPEYQARTKSLAAMYRSLTQQCLRLVDYAKIDQTTVETLILHMHGEYQSNNEVNSGMWLLSRTTVGLAMRIGMHRDGSNFPELTPFQTEMRRRMWAHIRMVDVIWSFRGGMPLMIKHADTDTRLPLNLNDEDFDSDTETMPPARPVTEITGISYLIVKADVASAFGNIIETVTGTGTISYDAIVKLNTETQAAGDRIFPALRLPDFGSEVGTDEDFPGQFAMRLSLDIQFNKALCVLHRKFLVVARRNTKYSLSRQVCINAALRLLHDQQLAKRESGLGGRVYRLQCHTGAYMNHDFILAATLVALDLLGSAQRIAAGLGSDDESIWGYDRQDEELAALETARIAWEDVTDTSLEASKAYSVCGVLINKIKALREQNQASLQQLYDIPSGGNTTRVSQTMPLALLGGDFDCSMPQPADLEDGTDLLADISDADLAAVIDWDSWGAIRQGWTLDTEIAAV